jgi:hypothetical protein
MIHFTPDPTFWAAVHSGGVDGDDAFHQHADKIYSHP